MKGQRGSGKLDERNQRVMHVVQLDVRREAHACLEGCRPLVKRKRLAGPSYLHEMRQVPLQVYLTYRPWPRTES